MSAVTDPFSGIVAFVHAAEARSLTAAARQLSQTPSAISKAITRLEAHVGVRLLHRSSRAVTLTPDGVAFFERCRQIVSDMDEARAALAQARTGPYGLLRVSLPLSFGRVVVMPLLPALLERHPGLRIEADLANRAVDLGEEGFDAAIRIGAIRDENLIARQLCTIRYLTAASPAYLARHAAPRTPAQLAQHRCIGLTLSSTRTQADWVFGGEGQARGIAVPTHLVVNSADAMVEAAVAGAGIVQTFDFLLRARIARGELVPVLDAFEAEGPAVHLAFARRRQQSPKLRVFVDYMLDQLSASASRGGGRR